VLRLQNCEVKEYELESQPANIDNLLARNIQQGTDRECKYKDVRNISTSSVAELLG
jgi:hypothetical protein